MSRFVNDATGVKFSVADEKDYRYKSGYTPAAEAEKKPPIKPAK